MQTNAGETAQNQRHPIRRNACINNGALDRDFSQGEKACQTRTAQRTAICRVQVGNAARLQPICYLVYCRLHRDKVFSRFAVTVIDDLNHMVILRKQANRVGERPLRLRRARQKQQRLFMFFSIFQSSHTIRPLVFAALFFRITLRHRAKECRCAACTSLSSHALQVPAF